MPVKFQESGIWSGKGKERQKGKKKREKERKGGKEWSRKTGLCFNSFIDVYELKKIKGLNPIHSTYFICEYKQKC